ncbi:hypothetical protein F2Q70_00016200 [Brassica cretica]|uniref:Uncharacterized protein n=1 Tax=Brassica cretica TaxID=69181 RepID=A0A8S9HQE8_BRACR|nr:hypothetical protein F2Q70_00016200 [Brassica cretica]KAF2600869.1 hypothetical protein F2Q68_00009180 [Brassica cretica]
MTSVKTDVDGDVTAENIQIGDQNGGRCHRWFRIASMDEGRVVLNAREWKGYL